MKEAEKRQVWTMGYFPFTVGGSVHQPIITEVEVIEEKRIGKGFKAFSFKTPTGTTRIAESVTGAIVAASFDEVIRDVAQSKKVVILEQIAESAKMLQSGTVKHYAPKEFFKLYKH